MKTKPAKDFHGYVHVGRGNLHVYITNE